MTRFAVLHYCYWHFVFACWLLFGGVIVQCQPTFSSNNTPTSQSTSTLFPTSSFTNNNSTVSNNNNNNNNNMNSSTTLLSTTMMTTTTTTSTTTTVCVKDCQNGGVLVAFPYCRCDCRLAPRFAGERCEVPLRACLYASCAECSLRDDAIQRPCPLCPLESPVR
jgi:hypothetical protein